ncbi:MAG: DNA-binding protein WhiA [Christensenellales bacterium]|jgi:DNA-binding protein WhiA
MPPSFSLRAKQEISREPFGNDCCMLSELAAFVRMAGTLEIASGGALSLRIDTENAVIAERIFRLIRDQYDVAAQIVLREVRRLGRRTRYTVRVPDSAIARRILGETGVLIQEETGSRFEAGMPADLVRRDCCRRAYLLGAFLAAGSVTNPERGYHAEFVVSNRDVARSLMLMLRAFQLNVKMMSRKRAFVVYLKESEHIVALLSLIGATTALLELENVRVFREIRNEVNRAVNCDTANLRKSDRAAARQIEAIRYIEAAGAFPALSKPLRTVAELRLEHPEATLQDLADMIPGLTRSGVNHRLRRLCAFAQELQERRGSNDDPKDHEH